LMTALKHPGGTFGAVQFWSVVRPYPASRISAVIRVHGAVPGGLPEVRSSEIVTVRWYSG